MPTTMRTVRVSRCVCGDATPAATLTGSPPLRALCCEATGGGIANGPERWMLEPWDRRRFFRLREPILFLSEMIEIFLAAAPLDLNGTVVDIEPLSQAFGNTVEHDVTVGGRLYLCMG